MGDFSKAFIISKGLVLGSRVLCKAGIHYGDIGILCRIDKDITGYIYSVDYPDGFESFYYEYELELVV